MKLYFLALMTLLMAASAIDFTLAKSSEESLIAKDEGKIKVMIIDSGIAPIQKLKPFLSKVNSRKDLLDIRGHGTHVSGLILYGKGLRDKVCDDVVIYSCKVFFPTEHTTENCFKVAKKFKVDIINFSGGGFDKLTGETKAIQDFPGVIVAAVGNADCKANGKCGLPYNLTKKPYYPAAIPKVIAVGNGTSTNHRWPSSNYGLPKIKWVYGVDIVSFSPIEGTYATMTGSSQSTALYTHKLVKERCQRRSAK